VKCSESAQVFADLVSFALREPDRFLEEILVTARANLERCVGDVAEYARQKPEKALLSAVATGYVLRMLPVTGLLRLFLRFALTLIKPAALIYTGAQFWHKIQPRAPTPTSRYARSDRVVQIRKSHA
jgi:hypothetical protein